MESHELFELARPVVSRRGRASGLSPEDREDLLQDVLAKYHSTWTVGQPDNVEAWLETATRNAIVDRVRVAERRPAALYAEGSDDPLALAVAAMRSSLATSDQPVRASVVRKVFGMIPDSDAELMHQRYIQGGTAAELAAELGISVANLDQRTTRANRRLREALIDRPDLVAELRAPHPRVY